MPPQMLQRKYAHYLPSIIFPDISLLSCYKFEYVPALYFAQEGHTVSCHLHTAPLKQYIFSAKMQAGPEKVYFLSMYAAMPEEHSASKLFSALHQHFFLF